MLLKCFSYLFMHRCIMNDVCFFGCLGAVGQAKHVTLTYMPFKTDITNMLAQLDNMLYSLQIQSNIIIHLNLCYWLPDIPSQFISILNGIFRIIFTILFNYLKLITVDE